MTSPLRRKRRTTARGPRLRGPMGASLLALACCLAGTARAEPPVATPIEPSALPATLFPEPAAEDRDAVQREIAIQKLQIAENARNEAALLQQVQARAPA